MFTGILLTLIAVIPHQSKADTVAAPPLDFSQCHEAGGPVLANDSPNRAYFQDLLARGTSAPLQDFLRLWYPGRPGSVDTESAAAACRAEESATVTVMSNGANGWTGMTSAIPVEERKCFYDTIYSWGSKAKLTTLQGTLADNEMWKGPPNPGRMLDGAVSAVGSHGYGDVPVRLKLRPGVFPPPTEYTIQTGNEVESWSFGAPEHYDEIVRDVLRFQSKKPWVGYWVTGSIDGTKEDKIFFSTNLDGHDFTEENLKKSLLEMISMVLKGEGRIYYAPGICRNRKLEFETRFPNYMDPFPDPTAAAALRAQRRDSAPAEERGTSTSAQ
jgi:hypothetical protein